MTVAAPPITKLTNYINGQWTDSHATEWRDVVNPATGEILASVPLADAAEVNTAVEAAARAFPDWRRTPPEDRIQPLFKLKMLLEEHIDELARFAAGGVEAAGARAITFNTITVSDGISMGTPGMRYSLVSREVIADSIETVVGAQGFDGVVAIGGCDKNMPGCLMALARLNRPAVFVYGGTIRPGTDRRPAKR